MLDELILTYPDKYEDMEPLFLEWEDTTRLLIQNQEIDDSQTLASQFWDVFSKVELRIHHNHSVSSRTLERWRHQRETYIDSFDEDLFDYTDRALEYHDTSEEISRAVTPHESIDYSTET